MLIVKSLEQPLKMRGSGQQDEDMEDLMRGAPDVEPARVEPFGYSSLL